MLESQIIPQILAPPTKEEICFPACVTVNLAFVDFTDYFPVALVRKNYFIVDAVFNAMNDNAAKSGKCLVCDVFHFLNPPKNHKI